ncbi:MAG: hypothetical protein AABY27_01615, partial [Pseudomonadota bacterium]
MSTTPTTNSEMYVAQRISNIYQFNAFTLSGTGASTAVSTYLAIATPTRSDLDTLRTSLNTVKNNLDSTQITIYNAVNQLIETIEVEFLFEQVGATVLSTGFNTEHTNGLTYARILSDIQANVADLTGSDITKANIATEIARTISNSGSSITTNLITDLQWGMDQKGSTAAQIQTAIAALSGLTDSTTISSNIIDGIRISTSTTTALPSGQTFATMLQSYQASDLQVTATSAMGTADVSGISTGLNTITRILGSTAITEVGDDSISGLLGKTSGSGSILGQTDKSVSQALGSTTITEVGTDKSISSLLGSTSGAGTLLGQTSKTVSQALGSTTITEVGTDKSISSLLGSTSGAGTLLGQTSKTVSQALGSTTITEVGTDKSIS